MKEAAVRSFEIEYPKEDDSFIARGTWDHILVLTNKNARKFNLSDDEKEELHMTLLAKAVMVVHSNYDPTKAKDETYVNSVLQHTLVDWKKERYEKKSPAEEWRDRSILYSPTRYGTVAKMLRQIDFDLAKELLTDDELELFERIVYDNSPIKDAGSGLGYSKRRTLAMWASIKDKFSRYYNRKLKNTLAQKSA